MLNYLRVLREENSPSQEGSLLLTVLEAALTPNEGIVGLEKCHLPKTSEAGMDNAQEQTLRTAGAPCLVRTLREPTPNLIIFSIIELKATNFFLAQKISLQGLGGRTKSKMGPTDETKYCHQAWGLSLAVLSLSAALWESKMKDMWLRSPKTWPDGALNPWPGKASWGPVLCILKV